MTASLLAKRTIMQKHLSNNSGVVLLQNGQYQQAVAAFKNAIEHLLRRPKDYINFSPRTRPVSCPLSPSLCERDLDASPGNMFSVYNFVFELPSEAGCDRHSILCLMIYNMALAHHRYALTGQVDMTDSLTTALLLYRKCMSVIMTELDERNDLSLLVMGCLNNMGFIYSHSGLRQAAYACKRNLELVIELPESRKLPLEQKNFFHDTIIHGNQELIAAAA